MLKNLVIFTLLINIFLTSNCFAQDSVAMVQQLIMRKDYVHAAQYAQESLEKNNVDKEKMLFYLGEALFYQNELRKAVDAYYKLVTSYPRSKMLEKTLLRTADAYYVMYDYKKAKNTYQKFLDRFETSQYLSYVYLKLVYCSEKLGLWEDKKNYMQTLKSRYPGTLEASKIDFLEERGYFFVVQIGAFGDKKNAIKLAKKVKADHFDVAIKEVDTSAGKLYKVIAGKFKARQNADALVEKLEKRGYPAKRFP